MLPGICNSTEVCSVPDMAASRFYRGVMCTAQRNCMHELHEGFQIVQPGYVNANPYQRKKY